MGRDPYPRTPVDGVAVGRSSVRLRQLSLDDEEHARQAHDELAPDGFAFLFDVTDGEPWPAYLNRLDKVRRGVDPAHRLGARDISRR
jgi:hypothetical protein